MGRSNVLVLVETVAAAGFCRTHANQAPRQQWGVTSWTFHRRDSAVRAQQDGDTGGSEWWVSVRGGLRVVPLPLVSVPVCVSRCVQLISCLVL